MTRSRAALALVAAAIAAVALLSGGSSADPRTPPALPGLPPPFLTAAVLGDGGLTAGVDAYGGIVDLRPSPAGRGLIENPYERQLAGTVPARTGIVPMVRPGGGRGAPLWRADSVRQRYLPGTNVLRTTARFGQMTVTFECAATEGVLGCRASSRSPAEPLTTGYVGESFSRRRPEVHLGDARAPRIVALAADRDRRWLARARPLGPAAPAWADAMYRRSLLVLRAATDERTGAVAAGPRDRWAYVWPRDAGAVAIALAEAGYRSEARRVARFLLSLDLRAAARFDGSGAPVEGRDAQGDAAGWTLAAARAAGVPVGARALQRLRAYPWRNRADYQERSPGTYLSNALAARAPVPTTIADGTIGRTGFAKSARRQEVVVDSAAAWAVRPFSRPGLHAAAARSLRPLLEAAGRYGIVPSSDWQERDPWTAPTAWTAWSLAALGRRAEALRLVGDLRRAATPAGLLPERVDHRSGVPRSTTPLAWSHAFTALALRSLWPVDRRGETGSSGP